MRPLREWLIELADSTGQVGKPLRLLLLERHADPSGGWWREAFGVGGGDAEAVARLLDPGMGPLVLPPLVGPEQRRKVLLEILKRVESTVRPPELEESLQYEKRLGEITWGGEPLFLLMAGLVAASSGFGEVLALAAPDLGFRIAGHELHRIHEIARSREIPEDLLAHLAAYVTLCRGLAQEEVEGLVEEEERALGCHSAGGPLAVYQALFAALPGDQGAVAPVLPDVVGEAVILEALGARSENKALAAISRATKQKGERVWASLIHLAQDYGAVREEPLCWFKRLAEGNAGDLASLVSLLNQLPKSTLALREASADLAERAVALARKQENPKALSGLLHALSNRLSDLGRREEALKKIEEAVELYREFTGAQPATFLPDLAQALNDLSCCLSELGRRELALSAIKEAVKILRELDASQPDAFRPTLVRALNNFSNRWKDLGNQREALKAIEEAVAILRELTASRPEAFKPQLAIALNNLANCLSESGSLDLVLATREEATGLHRELAATQPDAFRPDLARSLANLSISLGEGGRLEAALAASEEAVGLHRGLAEARPAAFWPYLALSLNNMSNCLRNLGRWNSALEAIEEAIAIRRKLAEESPEAFLHALAGSLGNMAHCLSAVGQKDAALVVIEEAVHTLASSFFSHPATFKGRMHNLVTDYLRIAQEAGRESDLKLVTAIQSLLGQGGSQDSAV